MGADRVGDDSDEALALELYPSLRRIAAVMAPPEVAPDDLLQDALVAVLRPTDAIETISFIVDGSATFCGP